MITGWKKDPVWRMYYAQKMKERFQRLRTQFEKALLEEALDKEAAKLLQKVQDEATKNDEPRH